MLRCRYNYRCSEYATFIKHRKEVNRMNTSEKLYYDVNEVAEMLGLSVSTTYKIMREMNQELKKKGYIIVAGKVPKAYFHEKYYGCSKS